MQKIIIATLATATLAKNTAVSQKLANLEIEIPEGLENIKGSVNTKAVRPKLPGWLSRDEVPEIVDEDGSLKRPNKGRRGDRRSKGSLLDKVFTGGRFVVDKIVDAEDISKVGLVDKVREKVSGFRENHDIEDVLEVAEKLSNIYELVKDSKAAATFDLLSDFMKYRALIDSFCDENDCKGDLDRMADVLPTVKDMDEEDSDIAIAVYRIAVRLFDVAVEEIKSNYDDLDMKGLAKKSKVIMNQIVKVIKEETDIDEQVVRAIIAQSDGGFYNFLELLKTVVQKAKTGMSMENIEINLNEIALSDLDAADLFEKVKENGVVEFLETALF